MTDFLFEISTEELPAGYIKPALDFMSSFLEKNLSDKRIDFKKVYKFSTPRRLALIINKISSEQKKAQTKIMGPPEKVAFKDGKLQTPGIKFAEKNGVLPNNIQIEETKKGNYIFVLKNEDVFSTKDILKKLLPELVTKIPFPKSMRWADLDLTFARPVKGFIALIGSELIEFEVEGIKSSRSTTGHRFHHSGELVIENPDQYEKKLKKAFVIADREKRRDFIKSEIKKAGLEAGGRVYEDLGLLDEVTNLVEYPVIFTGKFEERFLKLPDEVLYTAMKNHQKYFAVLDENGKMLPYFITVSNIKPLKDEIVIKGNEKVLRARLSDADFFFDADLEADFETWNKELENVMFQAKLGSIGEKVSRIKKNTEFICEKLGFDENETENAKITGSLSKSDLVSKMVDEFAELQGIMGRIYAKNMGYPDEVSIGIEEHYMPVSAGAKLPETKSGYCVSLADKLDSICGCFSIGLVPTGASDPYALRRQCIGIIQILKAKKGFISLKEMVTFSLEQFSSLMTKDKDIILNEVMEFFAVRMEQILVDEGYLRDLVSAVISADFDLIPNVWERVSAITALRQKDKESFATLASGFKRVENILKKIKIETDLIDESLFESSEEKALYSKAKDIKEKSALFVSEGKIKEALFEVSSIKDEVDSFFDHVMVMSDNEKIKNNRIALLSNISNIFKGFADFSRISG
ncbi:MAG: glycine--tRNA ligase subunit beta [Desulforegulaceae bacterium]|nr:glycine--tRNA ligase subunit beta [Desulforegulaceae bacterium]